jgi:peptide/nickel transport system substrate-binding protein
MNDMTKVRPGEGPAVSRRHFLRTAVAAGVGAAVAQAPSTAALAQAPRKGGRLRIAWSQQSVNDSLNPVRMNQNLDFLRVYSLMSPLVKWGRKFEATPDLAIAWEAKPDASTWYFRLRPNVEFHNGKTLTVEDVIYSLNLHRGPRSQSLVRSYFEGVSDIVADGPSQIKITLKEPNADFPVLLGDPHTVIVPAGFVDWDKPIGTGAFQLVEFRPGIGMLAKRFSNHYKSDSVFLDEVETFGISETTARTDALLSGDVQFINRVDARTAHLVKNGPGTDLVISKASRKLCINTAADRSPFDNLDLRNAIKYAADRQGMVKSVLQGYGQIANDLPIGPSDKYYCGDIEQRNFDLDRAKFLYKRSGHSGPLELLASDVNYGAPATDYAVHLKETASKAGIDIRVTRLPAEGYYSAVSTKKAFYITNWFPRPTLDLELSSVNLSNAPQAEPGYKNPKLDELAIEARRIPDGPKRAELYCEIQKMLWAEDGRTIPVFVDFIDGKSSKLQGVVPHPFSEAAGLRLCEEAWLSA